MSVSMITSLSSYLGSSPILAVTETQQVCPAKTGTRILVSTVTDASYKRRRSTFGLSFWCCCTHSSFSSSCVTVNQPPKQMRRCQTGDVTDMYTKLFQSDTCQRDFCLFVLLLSATLWILVLVGSSWAPRPQPSLPLQAVSCFGSTLKHFRGRQVHVLRFPHHHHHPPPPLSPACCHGGEVGKHGGECCHLVFPCTHPAFQAMHALVYLNVVSRNSDAPWKPEAICTHAHTQGPNIERCVCVLVHTCTHVHEFFLCFPVDSDTSKLRQHVRLMDGFTLLCQLPAHWSQFDPVFFFFFFYPDWRLHTSSISTIWLVSV